MLYVDLYRCASLLTDDYVSWDALSWEVVSTHERVASVQLFPCELDETISRGHLCLIPDSIPQEGVQLDALQIRYSHTLDEKWRRFVWCKDLMHVFDNDDAFVNTPERMLTLLEELETRPITGNASAMLKSEDEAEWMAIVVLCPLRLRILYEGKLKSGEMTIAEISDALRIPESAARSAMGDQYEATLMKLTGERMRGKPRRGKAKPKD